jgi:SPP1 gp7 family putative phage head morphogenesis protein
MTDHLELWKRTLINVDRSILVIDRVIALVWRALRHLIDHSQGYIADYKRALALLSRMPTSLVQAFSSEFSRLYKLGYLQARQLLWPNILLRTSESRSSLQEQGIVGLQLGATQTPQLVNLATRLRGKNLTDTKKRSLLKQMLFQPPSKQDVLRVISQWIRPSDWQSIGGAVTKQPHDLANELAAGLARGKSPREVAQLILPYMEDNRVRAQRTARTFGMAVVGQAQFDSFEALGDLVIGYQVHATLDRNTRPEHRRRDGTIYYKQPKRGQKGLDEMPRPPREADGSIAWNCRCYLTPVLREL